jgi:hypothetical protein
MTNQVQPTRDTDQLEADVTAVIEACGGDPRTAIRALLVDQHIQEQRIERLAAALSFGYVRGWTGVTPTQSGPATVKPPDHDGRVTWYRYRLKQMRNFEAIPCDTVIRGSPGVA